LGNRLASVIKRKTDFPLGVIYLNGVDGFNATDFFIDSRESPGGEGHGGFHIATRRNSKNISVDGVTIKSNKVRKTNGTDGIHIQNTKHIRIRNCDIDVYDDALPISANNPDSDVDDYLAENCRITSKIRFGRGMGSDIKNVIYRNITIDQTNDGRDIPAINFMIGGRGVEATGDMKDILFDGITMINVGQPVLHHGYIEGVWIGRSYDVIFKDITIKGSVQKASTFYGMERLTLNNISSEQSIGFDLKDVCGVSLFKLNNVLTNLGDSVTNVVWDGDNPVCSGGSTQPREISPPKGVRAYIK
jgi:polygalacturonase